MGKNRKRKWVKIDRAFRLFGPEGIMSEEVLAVDIPSKDVSREMGPFFTGDGAEVIFIEGYPRQNSSDVSPHFKPGDSKYLKSLRAECLAQLRFKNESTEHRKTKRLVTRILEELIRNRRPLPWKRLIPEASSFGFSGDFLSEAKFVGLERKVEAPPCGLWYRPDVAIFGRNIPTEGLGKPEPTLLGIVEIERDNRFDSLKGLIYQALSVPIITIDIRGMSEDEITERWVRQQLGSLDSVNMGKGRAFIHLPPTIYQTYVDIPRRMRRTWHEFIIFARDEDFETVLGKLDDLKSALRIGNSHTEIKPYNLKGKYDAGVEKTIRLLGPVAGADYRDYNDRRFIRVFCHVPTRKRGPVYLFQLIMSAILNVRHDVLVGYLHDPDMDSAAISREGGVWVDKGPDGRAIRIVPKRATIPLRKALKILEALDTQEE